MAQDSLSLTYSIPERKLVSLWYRNKHDFAIRLHTKSSDGTNTYSRKEFNTDVAEWQFMTDAYPYSSDNASKTIAYG